MEKMKRRLIFLLFGAAFFYANFTAVSYSATPPELEKIFDSAADKYLAKNWPGAIEDLKKYLSQDPGNLRAVGLLGRALEKRAGELTEKGELDKALRLVDEALGYSPELKDARDTKTKITKAIKVRDEKTAESRSRRAYAEKKRKEEAAARRARETAFNKKIENEKRTRELREKNLLEQVERQNKEIVDRKEEIEILRQQTNMIATKWLIYFSIAVLLSIAVSYFISSRIVESIASRTRRQHADSNERITELVNELAKKSNATESLDSCSDGKSY